MLLSMVLLSVVLLSMVLRSKVDGAGLTCMEALLEDAPTGCRVAGLLGCLVMP
ncbi:hypothetical protein [Streptomyces sp. NPDC048442]|uniref:hypothetical protein n=1 Tax=Streptomyces sp. NPDC048442 TaxID=3154823 RepID=UPI003440CAC0